MRQTQRPDELTISADRRNLTAQIAADHNPENHKSKQHDVTNQNSTAHALQEQTLHWNAQKRTKSKTRVFRALCFPSTCKTGNEGQRARDNKNSPWVVVWHFEWPRQQSRFGDEINQWDESDDLFWHSTEACARARPIDISKIQRLQAITWMQCDDREMHEQFRPFKDIKHESVTPFFLPTDDDGLMFVACESIMEFSSW